MLGLVANIIQLVDAAKTATNACHQFYKYGASLEHIQTKYVSDQLYQSYSSLHDSTQATQATSVFHSSVDLEDLSSKCQTTALMLKDEMQSIQGSPGGGRREAVSRFLQAKRKSKDIQKLRQKLSEYQKTLDSRVLVDVR